MRGRASAARRRFEELLAAAWHGVAFDRSKRFPKLDEVFGRKRRGDDAAVIAMLEGQVARGRVTAR